MGRPKKRNTKVFDTQSLTVQQKLQCDFISCRVNNFHLIGASNQINGFTVRFTGDLLEELNDYKICLEQWFSDTDITKEKVHILQNLLRIEELLNDGKSDLSSKS